MTPKYKPEKRQKKSKKPVKKVSSHGALIKKAHSLMRDIVLIRDNGCVCPPPANGHSSVRQAGHIVRSMKGGSRFSLWNVHEQCSSCNGRHTRDWQIYQEWFINEFSNDRWLAVLEESKNPGLKSCELEEVMVQLTTIKEKQLSNPEWKPRFTQQEILSGVWREKQ